MNKKVLLMMVVASLLVWGCRQPNSNDAEANQGTDGQPQEIVGLPGLIDGEEENGGNLVERPLPGGNSVIDRPLPNFDPNTDMPTVDIVLPEIENPDGSKPEVEYFEVKEGEHKFYLPYDPLYGYPNYKLVIEDTSIAKVTMNAANNFPALITNPEDNKQWFQVEGIKVGTTLIYFDKQKFVAGNYIDSGNKYLVYFINVVK